MKKMLKYLMVLSLSVCLIVPCTASAEETNDQVVEIGTKAPISGTPTPAPRIDELFIEGPESWNPEEESTETVEPTEVTTEEDTVEDATSEPIEGDEVETPEETPDEKVGNQEEGSGEEESTEGSTEAGQESTAGESENFSTEFSATIASTVVNVTIPLNVDIYINPNKDDGFVYGAIEVKNNTLAPVVVSVKHFNVASVPFESCISPENLPKDLDWDNMSVTETKKYFALGIKPIEYNKLKWEQELVDDYVYASTNFEQTALGVLSGGETAYLGLRSYYGKAFAEEISFRFFATFVVELKR